MQSKILFLDNFHLSNISLFISNGGFVKLPAATVTPIFKENEFAVINETGKADAPTTATNATFITLGSNSFQPTSAFSNFIGGSVVTGALSTGTHTFRMRLAGSSVTSFQRNIYGTLYVIGLN